jgi:acyl-CoA thioesterase I
MSAKNISNAPLRVTFFGDSICVGQGVSIYRGWVTRLAEQLDRHCSERGLKVVVANASVNGRTTRQALEDMPYHVQSHGVDLIVIQFGLNDCNYWLTDGGNARVSIDAFSANLKEIIARARTFGAKKILLNNNHPTLRGREIITNTNITYEDSNKAYNLAVRAIADELGNKIVFQDVERHFQGVIEGGTELSTLLLDDALHLSEAGHDRYLEFVGPRVKEALHAIISGVES